MAKDSTKVPEGFRMLTPVLCVSDAIEPIRFYERVFDARVLERHDEVGGKVSSATLAVADSSLMSSDKFSEHSRQHAGEDGQRVPSLSEARRHPSTCTYLTLTRCLARAVAEGARMIRPATD
jgi:uncharacterized glyoxalase superfamily protein PhnB